MMSQVRDENIHAEALSAFSKLERLGVPLPSLFILDCDCYGLTDKSGVYIAFTKNGECLYVGESTNLRNRVALAWRPQLEGADFLAIVFCDGDERMRVEKFYMGLFNPRNNREVKERRKARRASTAILRKKSQLGTGLRMLSRSNAAIYVDKEGH